MNNSRVLFAFLVCLVLCCLTWSKSAPAKPPSPTTLQEFEKQLKESNQMLNTLYLSLCLAAASSGKNYFQRPEMLTDDCQRTAAVTLNLFSTPSTVEKTVMMALWSMKSVVDDKSDQMPVEVLCKAINENSKEGEYLIDGFEQLKSQVTIPKPAKNYIVEVPAGSSITELVKKPFVVDDLGLLKLITMLNFYFGSHKTAVLKIARNDTLKATGDAVFAEARDHFVEECVKKQILSTDDPFKDFHKTVNEYYRKNPVLKDEYMRLVEKYAKKTHKNQIQPGQLFTMSLSLQL